MLSYCLLFDADYGENCIVVFGEDEKSASDFVIRNQIGDLSERDQFKLERAEEYDKYYPKFAEEGFISWDSKMGSRFYWENGFKTWEDHECETCCRSQYDDVPESTLFEIGESDTEHPELICFECVNEAYEVKKMKPEQQKEYWDVDKKVAGGENAW
jgi:hypothetical protein